MVARVETNRLWYIFVALSALIGLGCVFMAIAGTKLYDRLIGIAGGLFFLSGAAFVGLQLRGQTRTLLPQLGHDPISNLPTLTFPENPSRIWLILLTFIGITLVGLSIIIFPQGFAERGSVVTPLRYAGAVVVGGVCVAFSLWGIAVAYKRLRNPSGALVLTSQGLQFLYGTQRVSVEWTQIKAVLPYSVASDTGVAFILEETASPLSRLQQLNKLTAGFDLGVSLGCAIDPVAALVEFYCAHPEQRHEIGTVASLERYRALTGRWNTE